MSYCKINIAGKERELEFNQLAMLILREKTDPDFPGETAGYALVYAGLKASCYVRGEKLDLTWEQACRAVDTLSTEDVEKVTKAFEETEAYKQSTAYKEEQKKSRRKSAGKSTKANV